MYEKTPPVIALYGQKTREIHIIRFLSMVVSASVKPT